MKNIVVGISGGIAAYKSAELVRELAKAGNQVRVVLTESAKAFVTPLTLQTLSGHRVLENLLAPEQEQAMSHIELARWADVVLIAPATANVIAQLTHGEAGDLLTTLVLATGAPVILAPAMNQQMWHNSINQQNIATLTARGFYFIGPGCGDQACGENGLGRMVEPEAMINTINQLRSFEGIAVMITAGPTQEAIDPVRHLSNPCSGKMGYALAIALAHAGAKVTLVSGPTALHCPPNINRIDVKSAEQMNNAVIANIDQQTIFIATAAVSDYRPTEYQPQKLKKNQNTITLNLERTPDILANVTNRAEPPFCIGFAAESENIIEHAQQKLIQKKCDMIIANDITAVNSGFASEFNAVTIITKDNTITLENQLKSELATQIITAIAEQIQGIPA